MIQLAESKHILVGLFGDKGEVVRYSTAECLTVLGALRSRDMLDARIQERYQKILENAAPRGKR